MAVKQEYPCPEVGARVQIGTINDMLNNIGAYDYLDRSSNIKRMLVNTEIPAGFSAGMIFLEGKEGTLKKIDHYTGGIDNCFLKKRYARFSFAEVLISFDDPKINKRAKYFSITTPMLVQPKKLDNSYYDLEFKQNLEPFSVYRNDLL